MARQDVNIGVEGNDGTGDSIRESFRKVNENFQEVYAIFGQSGTISFTALSDTPDSLLPSTIPLVKADGSGIDLVEFASNNSVDSTKNDTIVFNYTIGGKLVISTAFTELADDTAPAMSAPLNAGGNAIANIDVSVQSAQQFNDIHNTNINVDDLVINKGYADRRYISSGLPIRVAPEPLTQDPYKLNITRYINGDIEVVAHGYDTSINGLKFVFNSIYDDPSNLDSEVLANQIVIGNTYKIKTLGDVPWTSIGADLGVDGEVFIATATTSGTGVVQPVYFLRYVTDNFLSVFLRREDAALVNDTEADAAKNYVSGTKADDDVHEMIDTGVDATLAGNYLSDVAMPRDSIVRRQGDAMEGPLTLSDHPGDLEGFGKPNGADDLQAATKFYVDNAGYASTQNIFVSLDGDDRMIGVPPGKEGASLNYAYRTINAAAQRAEEVILTAEEEPGPYFQTVTKEDGASPAEVTATEFVGTDTWGGQQTADLIRINREYLSKELSGWIKYTFPDFVYEISTCERDTGLILDAVEYDIRRGLTANFLSRIAAERYYSSTSGRIAITQQKTETVGAINQLKTMTDAILQNKLFNEKSIDFVTLSGSANERARVQTTTDHGLVDGDHVVFKDMGGMVEIEGQTAYVKNIEQTDIALDGKVIELYKDDSLLELWDISAYTPYTAGGKLGQVFQERVRDFDSVKLAQTFDEPDADATARLAITGSGGKFDLIVDIMSNGINAGADIVYGRNYKIVLDNGARTFVDQGDPDNTDLLPGKVVVGNISGAKGRIVKVINNDGTESNNDTIELLQLNGVDFAPNETVRYGNFVKEKQVTIFVESGIYEEDLPIKISNNVSLKGDEFRRVIIRPKNRVSQSPWANTYFFRDADFDDMTLATTGEPFVNQVGDVQGYFGRHYLSDNTTDINIGGIVTNPGNYTTASKIMQLNKAFIQDEVIEFINTNNPSFIYDIAKCRRDTGLIVDALVKDLVRGGQEFTIETQGQYQDAYISEFNNDGFGGQEAITQSAINHISVLAQDLLNATAPAQNGATVPDISLGAGEAGTVTIADGLVDLVNFAFNAAYNPPLRNDAQGMDVFMMSDASILRNATVQGHGGFMVVLDPEGQVLTKSPYIQTGSSFSKSDNEKRFRGGMYVDAFTGNIPVTIPQNINTGTYNGAGKLNNFEMWVQSSPGQGLFVRPPQLPCPFYVEGRRYQVNAISEYDSGNGWCKIFLDADSNDGVGYDESQFDDGLYYRDIFLQTAGNRSMLGNDFTQINDLGYGLVTNNGAFSEMVSMFTYYCQVAYYAKNGSEIRSLNGSNGYGNFGLVAEGADPNEIPDQVTLKYPMAVPAKAYTSVDTPNAFEDTTIYVTDMRYPPSVNSLITIDHGGVIGVLNYVISNVTNISDTDNDGQDGETVGDIVAVGGTYSNAVYKLDLRADEISATDFFGSLRATVPNGAFIEFRNNFTQIFEGVRDPSKLVTRPSTAINYDESDDATYRSLVFQAADTFAQPLANDEVLTGLEIGYNFVSPEIDTGNLGGGYGSAQGDDKIAIKPLDADRALRITRDVAGKQPGDAGYAGGMVFTWQGKLHQVTDYNDSGAFVFINIADQGTNISSYSPAGISTGISASDRVLNCGLNIGATAEITIAISLCRATGHDFTQIGTGGFNDSNYPNVILGDPENNLAAAYTDGATAISSQVWERRKGRVFWMSTDQNGFFRVGKFFSVDQATGDITFAGEIGISNANSLGFKRGVTINEFSADDSMSDNSGQATPTEKAVVGYINRVLGWNVAAGSQIQTAPAGNRIGVGFLPLNGNSTMEGDIDMGSNQITNVALPGVDGTAAANKNYVDDKVNDYDQLEDLRNIEFNSIASDDIIVATGKKRIVVDLTSGGNWTTGTVIGLLNSGSKAGTIVDIESITDSLLGNKLMVTYTATAGVFNIGETLYDKPGQSIFGTIIDGPIDEVANASEAAASDINVTVTRTASGAEYNLQYEADSLIDNDVKSNAGIRQSKLLMQAADTFVESTGWTGAKAQADLGLAKFSADNFNTSDGFVRIKNNGVVFAEIPDLTQYKVYGRTASGSGDASAVSFSDIAKFGAGIEDKDFTSREWSDPALTKLVFTSGVSVNDGDTLTQGSASGTVQGKVNNETTVYVSSVTNTFNTSNNVLNTTQSNTSIGTPTTAQAVTERGAAMIRLGEGVYATTSISSGTAADTIVRRGGSGEVDAAKIKVGGFDTIALSSTTITFKTPGTATVFEATGNTSADLQVKVPGHLVLGGITNSGGNFVESAAKSGSTSFDDGSYVASSWMYTNFIEAASESGGTAANTTGIGLGDGNGFTGDAADTILLIAKGAPRVTIKETTTTVENNLKVDGTCVVDGQTTINDSLLINSANEVFRIRNGVNSTNRFLVDSDNGNTTIAGTITVGGLAQFNGSVNLGDAASDTVTFVADVDSNIIPDGNGTRNLGASGSRWNTVYGNTLSGVATTAKYADLAENYVGDEAYEPGTVVVFGGEAEVTTTTTKGDRRVAGVVSTDPGFLMNSELDTVNTVAIALQGRVPCKVIGSVFKGDMLVASAIPGYAMVDNDPKIGTVIGKAVETKLDPDKGVVEVVVGRT
jgi:hypothetical protein